MEKCPYCQSVNIDSLDMEIDEQECSQSWSCYSCEKQWARVYTFVGIFEYSKENK